MCVQFKTLRPSMKGGIFGQGPRGIIPKQKLGLDFSLRFECGQAALIYQIESA